MSDKFTIAKTGTVWAVWWPAGFDDVTSGVLCDGFTEAVAAFMDASERQCPECLRGEVVDTVTGWECRACGSYDVGYEAAK